MTIISFTPIRLISILMVSILVVFVFFRLESMAIVLISMVVLLLSMLIVILIERLSVLLLSLMIVTVAHIDENFTLFSLTALICFPATFTVLL